MRLSSRFSLLIFCFFLFSIFVGINAQKIKLLPTTQWHGLKRVNFLFNDIPAYYIKPPKPLPGSPWVRRAHFPNWHINIDSLLQQKGLYVVYNNTNDRYGAPKALRLRDDFYNYMTQKLQKVDQTRNTICACVL